MFFFALRDSLNGYDFNSLKTFGSLLAFFSWDLASRPGTGFQPSLGKASQAGMASTSGARIRDRDPPKRKVAERLSPVPDKSKEPLMASY